MKKMAGRAVAIGMLVALAPGCSTIGRVGGDWEKGKLYPGTTFDAMLLESSLSPDSMFQYIPWPFRGVGLAVGIVDLPLSLVTDTVMLPADVAARRRVRAEKERKRAAAAAAESKTAQENEQPEPEDQREGEDEGSE